MSSIQQKLFQFFLPQEAGAFANNIEKKPQSYNASVENTRVEAKKKISYSFIIL